MPHSLNSIKVRAVFFTLLAGALWGTSFPIIKIGLNTINPFAFVFWRFFVSCVTLIIIMVFLKKFSLKVENKKLVILLGIANAAGYILQYVGMPFTSAAKAALFINLSAMWVAILSPKLLGEHLSHKKITGVLFGLMGIIFVSTNLDLATLTQGQLAADILLIISGIIWALFMMYNKKLTMASTSATFQSMAWVLIFTFLSIAPFGLMAGPGFFFISGWEWAAIIWTAIVCWIIPYYLWFESLKHLSASTSTILLLSEIVVAVIASITLLKEPVTVFSSIGALFIVVAILFVSINNNHFTRKK